MISPDDTIAAISTPSGQGGIGIVRLSGRDAIKIADRIFLSPKKKKLNTTPSHRIIYGHIIVPKSMEIVDEALVSVMRAPNTYTREDIAEINCHGGPVPLRRVLELVLKEGARLAGPGEFTQRAFLNGRIDLAQAEAVMDIINSLTVQSQKAAVRQLQGNLSSRISEIREKLLDLTALVEAYIDFPEEDIETPSLHKMDKSALEICRLLRKLIEGSRYGQILREGLRTAITGRPNVGKSSLLNALLDEEKAIVTEIPGTTRDIVEDFININGLPLRIMDTAGIRSVRNIVEKEGVRRSLKAMEEADLILLVLDGSRALHKSDMELLNRARPESTLIIINKSDLPQKLKMPAAFLKNFDMKDKIIKLSAKNKAGIDQLKEKIFATTLGGPQKQSLENVTNIRHVNALERTLSSVERFSSEARKKKAPEFLSVELREALDAIGEIIGVTATEDILNRIFSRFCIGK